MNTIIEKIKNQVVSGQNGFFAKKLGFKTIGDIFDAMPKDLFVMGKVGEVETVYILTENFFASRTDKKITKKHLKGIILEYLKSKYYGFKR